MGRKRIEISPSAVDDLSDCICDSDVAKQLGTSLRTLYARQAESAELAAAIKNCKVRGKGDLEGLTSRKLRQLATNGDTTALIWLEKSRLGYSDRMTAVLEGEVEIAVDRGDAGTPAWLARIRGQQSPEVTT